MIVRCEEYQSFLVLRESIHLHAEQLVRHGFGKGINVFTNTLEELVHLRMKILVGGVERSRKVGAKFFETFPFPDQISNQQILVVLGQKEHRLNAVFVARIAEGDEQFLILNGFRQVHKVLHRYVFGVLLDADLDSSCVGVRYGQPATREG